LRQAYDNMIIINNCIIDLANWVFIQFFLQFFSGMTCRILCEFGMSAIHHPTEAVRKAAERILVHVYKVNPRFVRKQLPPDDEITRRNIMYRQLMQEFERIDQEVSANYV